MKLSTLSTASAVFAASAFVSGQRLPGSPYAVASSGLNATTKLNLYDTSFGSADDAFTAMTLQGVLSKALPRIFRADRSSPWFNLTASTFGVEIDTSLSTNLTGLVQAFASDLDGFVLVDMNDNSTNIGIAAAAAENVIAFTTDNQNIAVALGLQLKYDLRGKDLAWVLATFNDSASGFTYSPSLTVYQQATKSCCMGDYAIATGALQWWQDSPSSPLANQIWDSMTTPGFAQLGWGPDELSTTAIASAHGGVVVGSDWAENIDVLSNFGIPQFTQPLGPTSPPAETTAPAAASNVHTVCFLMTDGDNVQWLLSGFATQSNWFGSPDRGHVPMGWTLSPSLSELAPIVMKYLYDNGSNGTGAAGSGNQYADYFVGGVSGYGYFYPDSIVPAAPNGDVSTALSSSSSSYSPVLDTLTNLTSEFMRKSDMRIVNILSHGEGFSTNELPASYLQHDNIDAIFWYNYDDYSGMQGNITFVPSSSTAAPGSKPVIGGRYNLWGDGSNPSGPTFKNVTGLVDALLTLPRDPTTSYGYSLIPVHAWSHNVTDVRAVFEALQQQSGGGVEVVTPDVFVQRIVANVQH